MDKITATYQITTPMFMSGGNKESAELRPASFKGVLRFWYRAIAPTILQANWQQSKKLEQELFGSADGGGGQAGFLMQLQTKDDLKTNPADKKWSKTGSAYLGYGPINNRPYITEKQSFTVVLLLKPPPKQNNNHNAIQLGTEQKARILIQSLQAVGLFGGLGSRSRRGFGSVSLESLEYNGKQYWTPPQNSQGLKQQIEQYFKQLGPKIHDEMPEHSAFSTHSRIVIVNPHNNPLELLNHIGEEMIRYRSYGRRSGTEYKILRGEKAQQLFKPDHDLIWQAVQGRAPANHPRRALFGLPHNYRFSSRQNVSITTRNYERRGSPLFIHIHQLDQQYVAILTLLAAQFLPPAEEIKITAARNINYYVPVNNPPDYTILNNFINGFTNLQEVKFH